jgi:hypothetical protein
VYDLALFSVYDDTFFDAYVLFRQMGELFQTIISNYLKIIRRELT